MSKLWAKILRSPQAISRRLHSVAKYPERVRHHTAYELARTKWRRPEHALDRLILRTRHLDPVTPSISHWADWCIGRYGFTGDLREQPRTVFVKADPPRLRSFVNRYLPLIQPSSRFVLISGDADETLPRQTDVRHPSHRANQLEHRLNALADDQRLIHWFAENLDTSHPKLTPLPLGYLESDGHEIYRKVIDSPPGPPIRTKPLKALCAHRIRNGPQWEPRRTVTQLAQTAWSDFVDHREDIPAKDFISTIQRYPFVICVGGGGLDPSPKAWTALLAGAIPIIQRNPTTAAYSEFPVLYVEDWKHASLSKELLRDALHRLSPHFDNPSLRATMLQRLSMGYWLDKVREKLPPLATS